MSHDAYRIVATKPGGIDVFRKEAFTPGQPGPGQLLIRQTAIGVNFVDIYFRTGLYNWPAGTEGGLTLGCEGAGVVEAIGDGIEGLEIGDRVAYTVANGAYASHRLLDASQAVWIPDDVSDEVAAAAILKGLTVNYLVNDSFPIEAGDSVLFHAAAGGVGLIAGQWIKAAGADLLIGTAGGPEKCALAKSYGYDEMIDYKSENFVERVRELTDGDLVNVVYDSVGKDTYPGSLHCLRRFGHLVNFGQSSGPALDFKLSDLAAGSFVVSRPILFHFTADREWLDDGAAELFGLIGDGQIEIKINQTFPLEEAGKAHELLAGRKTTGSTVLIP